MDSHRIATGGGTRDDEHSKIHCCITAIENMTSLLCYNGRFHIKLQGGEEVRKAKIEKWLDKSKPEHRQLNKQFFIKFCTSNPFYKEICNERKWK